MLRIGRVRPVVAARPWTVPGFPLLLLCFLAAPPPPCADAAPRPPALPVARLDEAVRPAFRADRIELRLGPRAAARARIAARRPARPDANVDRIDLLGVPELDRAARALGGVWFEPEFPGETYQGSDGRGPDFTSYYLAHLPPGTDLATALATLRSLEGVASADPIALLEVDAVPNDSLWTNAWWLFDAAGRNDVHAPEAWDVWTGDASVRVAVLDTGLLPYHPDLGGTAAGGFGNVWTNAAEAAGFVGVDDDGNGYVDDVHGWDFVDLPSPGSVSAGEDWRDEDNDPNDYAGHGTAVAGLIGSLANNGIGIPGVAWNVRLMPLRVSWAELGDPLGIVDMAFAARAIRYATRAGADVINCSFETVNTSGLDAAARAAADAGILIVNAAGNGGSSFHDLADRDDVLAVAMTDANDQLSPLSNSGDYVDVSAPGVLVQSAFVAHAGTDSLGYRQPDYRAGLTGTSFSAPVTAGVAALVVAYSRASGWPLRKRELLFRLRETADDIAAQNPGVTGYGTGRVNAFRAVTETEASFAVGGAGALTGAPAVILGMGVENRLACATTDRRLLFLGAMSGDTLGVAALPADPIAAPPAAADLGGGLGAGVFVSLRGALVAGYDAFGRWLSGWPALTGGVPLATGPALGDLDGDGTTEVVCGAETGLLYAWHADGSPVEGFPNPLDGSDITGIAISDLDGQPGEEVIVSTAGAVHAVRAGAAAPSVPGWPRIVTSPTAPLVMRLGARSAPCVVVGTGTSLRAYEASGAVRWSRNLAATPSRAPAAADVDGDGFREIVVPVSFPGAIAVVDSGGLALSARGFPLGIPGVIESEVIVRTLDAAPASHLYAVVDGRLLGFDGLAGTLAEYPKVGRSMGAPTVYAGSAGGPVRAVSGSAFDSLIYLYRTPSSTATGAERGWYTVRGNFARTASRVYEPPPAVLDDRPGRVTDVAVVSAGDTSVTLRWTATGEDGVTGRPLSYDVRAAQEPVDDDAAFAAAPHARVATATVDAGGVETFRFDGVAAGRTWWFALKARDAQAQESALSNTVAATTGPGGPLQGVAGPAIATRAQPSRLPVSFYWKRGGGAAAGVVRIHDMAGRRVRTLAVGPAESGVVQWNGRDEEDRLVPAGVYFARLTSGSIHAQTRVVLLP